MFDKLAQSLSLIFGIEAIIVLKDIWGLDDDEVREIALWAAHALVATAVAEASSGRPASAAPRTKKNAAERPREKGLAAKRHDGLPVRDEDGNRKGGRTHAEKDVDWFAGRGGDRACRRAGSGAGADHLLGRMGSCELPAGARQRIHRRDRRDGHRADDAVAGFPDQGLHRVQRARRCLRHGRRRLAVARRRLDGRPLRRPDRLLRASTRSPS